MLAELRPGMCAGKCARTRNHAVRIQGGVIVGEFVSVVVFGAVDTIAVWDAWQIFLVGRCVGRLQTGYLSKHG